MERWRGRGWTSGCLTVWAEGLAGRGPPWVPCVSRATPEAGPGPPGGGQEGARPTALPLTRVLSRSDKSGGSLCWGWGSAGSGNNPRPPDRERFTSILLLAGAAAPRVLEARGRALPSLPPLPPPPGLRACRASGQPRPLEVLVAGGRERGHKHDELAEVHLGVPVGVQVLEQFVHGVPVPFSLETEVRGQLPAVGGRGVTGLREVVSRAHPQSGLGRVGLARCGSGRLGAACVSRASLEGGVFGLFGCFRKGTAPRTGRQLGGVTSRARVWAPHGTPAGPRVLTERGNPGPRPGPGQGGGAEPRAVCGGLPRAGAGLSLRPSTPQPPALGLVRFAASSPPGRQLRLHQGLGDCGPRGNLGISHGFSNCVPGPPAFAPPAAPNLWAQNPRPPAPRLDSNLAGYQNICTHDQFPTPGRGVQ